MTYGELRFTLSKLVPGTDPDVLDAGINDRLESIANHLAWRALETDGVFTAVADTGIYDLAADYRGPVPGEASNPQLGVELRYVNHAELTRRKGGISLGGEPRFWSETSRASGGVTRRAELFPVPGEDLAGEQYPYKYIRSLPRYAATDTALEIPGWISIPCLKAGVRAEITGDPNQWTLYGAELAQMRAEDARTRGPRRLRMAAVFTAHRIRKVPR